MTGAYSRYLFVSADAGTVKFAFGQPKGILSIHSQGTPPLSTLLLSYRTGMSYLEVKIDRCESGRTAPVTRLLYILPFQSGQSHLCPTETLLLAVAMELSASLAAKQLDGHRLTSSRNTMT
jgi:hypothetical protein